MPNTSEGLELHLRLFPFLSCQPDDRLTYVNGNIGHIVYNRRYCASSLQGCFVTGDIKMVVPGVVHNGLVVPNEPLTVPEGTHVTIEIANPGSDPTEEFTAPRQGGWWKGQATIAPDFDDLPDEIREAFGMN